jgi:uncharacterized OB-fold protein
MKMEFKDFSLFLNHTKVKRFVDDLASGKIMGTKCKKCGLNLYPPRADCPECYSSEMEWVALKAQGKLATYTMIYVPPDHFTTILQMPFSKFRFEPCPIGLLELENGLRIMGWIPKVNPKEIKVDMTLKAEPQVLPGGKVTIVLNPV